MFERIARYILIFLSGYAYSHTDSSVESLETQWNRVWGGETFTVVKSKKVVDSDHALRSASIIAPDLVA